MTPASDRGFSGIAQSTRLLLLLAALLVLFPALSARAELGSPTLRDKIIAQHVAVYLERAHVRRWKLDDERSESMFDSYLSALDPQRMYFTAADVEGFQASRHKIDDYIKSGDLDFAFKVGKVFLARVDECSKRVKKLVEQEQDFTADEYFQVDRAEASYASGEKEIADLWRKRVKVLLLEKLVDGKTMKEAGDEVVKLYENFAVRMG
ncbi:MAG: hypothetical protein VX387_04245, partial [Planctomycetota bacterium]|nr:hypothetical protein [Planctomycetota bacterium]